MGLFKSYGKKSDEALMVLVQNGDHRAFGYIYDRYSRRLKAFFFRMMWSDEEKAEDMLHDLFAKIIDRPGLFKHDQQFKPWIFQIASNMCKNAYRRRAFELEYLNQLENEGIGLPEVERIMDEEIQMDRLVKLLERMDEDEMTLFLLRYQQDMSIVALAEVFKVPEGTIKSRLFKIRAYLVKKLVERETTG